MEIQTVELLESSIYSYQIKEQDAQRLNSLMLEVSPEETHIDFNDNSEKEGWLYKVIHNFGKTTDMSVATLDIVQIHKGDVIALNVEGDGKTVIIPLCTGLELTLESEREKRVLTITHGTVVIIPIDVVETYAMDISAVGTNDSSIIVIQ